jgi:nucleoside-diphosphate kinase
MKLFKEIRESFKNMEFVIIKPGFERYKDEILDYLVKNGLVINKVLKRHLSLDKALLLYIPHYNKDFYWDLCEYMSSGDSIGYLLYNPKKVDILKLKDNIRKIYGKDEMHNAIHSSDSKANVKRESNIYFN